MCVCVGGGGCVRERESGGVVGWFMLLFSFICWLLLLVIFRCNSVVVLVSFFLFMNLIVTKLVRGPVVQKARACSVSRTCRLANHI